MCRGSSSILLFSFWILLTILNCRGKKESLRSSAELETLVTSFVNECSKRGLNVEVSPKSLLVGFGRIESKAGRCKPNSYPKVITFDSVTWRTLSPQLKEMLVYHELAHCLLDKKHNNEVFKFGECKSWMRENDSTCSINTLNSVWRAYYINELFAEERVPSPDWYDTTQNADLNEKSKPIDLKIIKSKLNTLVTLVFDSTFINNNATWMIKFNFVEPENLNGSIGMAINEYAIQFSSRTDLSHANPNPVFSRAIVIQQYNYLRQVTIVSWDTLKSIHKKTDMSIKKTDQAIFVFFEKDLKLCIPIGKDKIALSGYAFFEEENPYSIKVYE